MSRIRVPVLLLITILTSACAKRSGIELNEIYHFDTSGWAHDISLEGRNLWVADREGGFLVFNSESGYKLPRISAPVKDVVSLCPNSGLPLLASRFEGIVLLSRSGAISDRFSIGDIANAVEVRRDLAFSAYGANGLVVFRVMNDRIKVLSKSPPRGWSHDLRLSSDQALLADWHGLRILDVGNPEKPEEIAFLPSPGSCISLAVKEASGGRLLALAEGHAGVGIAVLDEAGHPKLLGRNYLGLNPADETHPKTGGWVHSVAWAGRYVFAANWKRGLAVLDARDPTDPQFVVQIPTSGTSLGVKTHRRPDGSYLVYLADGSSGLRIFHFRGLEPNPELSGVAQDSAMYPSRPNQ